MKIDIEELKVVRIEPGDVILLRTSMPLACVVLDRNLTMELYRQREKCEAQQVSDQMTCMRCELNWDVNDSHPPRCPLGKR